MQSLQRIAAAGLIAAMIIPNGFAQSSKTTAKKKTATTSSATTTTTTTATSKAPPAITAEDIKALRDALEAQQIQINQLRQELAGRDEAVRRSQESADRAQAAAEQANNKASAAQTSGSDIEQLKTDVADVKLNQQNAALSAQDDQKRLGAAEGVLGRFRFTGDVRVRGESFYQSYSGCVACPDRQRVRIRARFGFEGKLNEDFNSGIFLATGAVVNGAPDFKDPVSTNETLTSFYERKSIGLDRAWVTYNPVKHKWLSLTGGKFAYTWNKTVLTFDNDLNPEGFNEKFSFDLSHAGVFKNVTVQGMQFLYNEISGVSADSNAVGGSFSTRMQLAKRITFTPTYTLLNWNGSDAIAQAASPVTPNPTLTIPEPVPPATSVTVTIPLSSAQIRTISANTMTNATAVVGTGNTARRVFVSDFMYSDFIGDIQVKTWSAKWPFRFFGEYEKNLRARPNTGALYAGNQDTMYMIAFSMGRQTERHDLQVGYDYANVDQDAVISQFNESDMRAPTNVIQNRFFATWLVARNVSAGLTWWIGHTKDRNLQNAALAPGLPAGMKDPWLNRLQFDLIYKF